jgi:hypothetical protein
MSALLDRILKQHGDICAAKHQSNPESIEAKNLNRYSAARQRAGLPKPFTAAPAAVAGFSGVIANKCYLEGCFAKRLLWMSPNGHDLIPVSLFI